MSGKTANSIFGPDGYEDTPIDMVAAYTSGVFAEDNFPSPQELKRDLKRQVNIRLDRDVYEFFRSPEPTGYQTRINAVLRHYMSLVRKVEIAKTTERVSKSLKKSVKKRP